MTEQANQTEQVPCPFCGSTRFRNHRTMPDRLLGKKAPLWHVVKCEECATAYLNPRPALEALGQHYPSEYIPYVTNAKAERRFRFAEPDKLSPRDRAFMAHYLGYTHYLKPGDPGEAGVFPPDFDMSLAPPPPWREGGGRLLEIGCSHGLYLERVRELGWEVEGLELGEDVVKIATEQRGLQVRQGFFERGLFPGDAYDAVALWHVLEHLPDPMESLIEIRRLLKPDGSLLVGVPNVEGFAAGLARSFYASLDPPRHFTDFSPATLDAFLGKAGFEVVWLLQPATMRDLIRSMKFMADAMNLPGLGKRIYASRKKRKVRKLEQAGGRFLARWNLGSRLTVLARPKA